MAAHLLTFGITAQIALIAYLLFQRVELEVIFHIISKTLLATLFSLPVLFGLCLLIPPLAALIVKPGVFQAWWSGAVALGALTSFVLALTFARDQVISRHGAIEIVLLNIAAIFASGMNPLAHYLLSPVPHSVLASPFFWWLNFIVQFWPSGLVLAMLRRKEPHDLRLRFLLSLWVVATYIVMLAPLAWHSLTRFDSSSAMAYVWSLMSCFVAVHVALLVLALLASGESGQPIVIEEGPAKFFASRVELGGMKPGLVLLIGAGFWLSLRMLVKLVEPGPHAVSLSLLFLVVVAGVMTRFTPAAMEAEPAEAELEQEEHHGAALESLWENRKGLLALLIPVIGAWLYFGLRPYAIFYANRDGLYFLEAIGFASLAILLCVAAWIATMVMDGLRMGNRRWIGAPRRRLMLAGVALLALWQLAGLPPPGAYDPPALAAQAPPASAVEVETALGKALYAVDNGQVYIGPAEVTHLSGARGHALFLQRGRGRWALCRDHTDRRYTQSLAFTLTHFQIFDGKNLECRYTVLDSRVGKDRQYVELRSVSDQRADVLYRSGFVENPLAQAVAGAAAKCTLEAEPAPQVRCGNRVQPLPVAADSAAWPTPAAWHIGQTQRMGFSASHLKLACLTAEVDGPLPGGQTGRWPALVITRSELPENLPMPVVVIYDSSASCQGIEQHDAGLYFRLSDASSQALHKSTYELKLLSDVRTLNFSPVKDGDSSLAANCSLEAAPQARVRCGAWSRALDTDPLGQWPRPRTWHLEQVTRVQVTTDLVTLACLSAEVDGVIGPDSTPQRYRALVVVRLEPQPATEPPVFQFFDSDARCDRIEFYDAGLLPHYRASEKLHAVLDPPGTHVTMQNLVP